MTIEDEAIIVEQKMNCDKARAWSAITKVEEMRLWFFDAIPNFEAREGFETEFTIDSDTRSFLHVWKIVEVIEEKKIKFNWKYKGYAGDSYVTFELIDAGSQVIVRLTTEVIESFPQDIPEFKRESAVGGWNYFIKESLKNYLG